MCRPSVIEINYRRRFQRQQQRRLDICNHYLYCGSIIHSITYIYSIECKPIENCCLNVNAGSEDLHHEAIDDLNKVDLCDLDDLTCEEEHHEIYSK